MSDSDYLKKWYQNASVRIKDHIVLDRNSTAAYFPEELVPFCQHSIISESKKPLKKYVLTQLCYKYLEEICITENDVVNPIALRIAYGDVPIVLDESIKADAFSIMIDEAFHSYAARALKLQIQQHSGIPGLILPRGNEVTKAIQCMKDLIPLEMHNDFELIATCISENVFTDEIITISRFATVNPSFHQLMVDHARDEGRHAGYFVKIMQRYWEQASLLKKDYFAEVIPKFITLCLDGVHDTEFLLRLLNACQLPSEEVNELMSFNQNNNSVINKQTRLANIRRFLKRSGVLTHPALELIEV